MAVSIICKHSFSAYWFLFVCYGILLSIDKNVAVIAFSPPTRVHNQQTKTLLRQPSYYKTSIFPYSTIQSLIQLSAHEDDNKESDNDSKNTPPQPVNPYADPNYPDLEFVNYDDPEYQAYSDPDLVAPTSSSSSASSSSEDVEEQIEAMREDQRRRNDEYQFQTYFQNILKNGRVYKGEWTHYQSSVFFTTSDDTSDKMLPPQLIPAARPMAVISRGYKQMVDTDSPYPVDAERICHEETVVTNIENDDKDKETAIDDFSDLFALERHVVGQTYWPSQLSAMDFRGERGIMCVGNAYTICHAIPIMQDQENTSLGPFREYRAEIGIESEEKRLRVKFDYSVLDSDDAAKSSTSTTSASPPSLYLRSMTVCREALDDWPLGMSGNQKKATTLLERAAAEALFGPTGAEGGIFDPPPIYTKEQAENYMMMELPGRATILFPYRMDQEDGLFDGNGWVKTLDWTSGQFRYQVDRKVTGGSKLLGLRTLELSSIQQEDAEEFRPRDGGQDMRQ